MAAFAHNSVSPKQFWHSQPTLFSLSSIMDERSEMNLPDSAGFWPSAGNGQWRPMGQPKAIGEKDGANALNGKWMNGMDGNERKRGILENLGKKKIRSMKRIWKKKWFIQIIPGNVDTQSAVFRQLDGGIVAKLVRLIPVSESIRTVCMRFELYGCTYKGVLS